MLIYMYVQLWEHQYTTHCFSINVFHKGKLFHFRLQLQVTLQITVKSLFGPYQSFSDIRRWTGVHWDILHEINTLSMEDDTITFCTCIVLNQLGEWHHLKCTLPMWQCMCISSMDSILLCIFFNRTVYCFHLEYLTVQVMDYNYELSQAGCGVIL